MTTVIHILAMITHSGTTSTLIIKNNYLQLNQPIKIRIKAQNKSQILDSMLSKSS